MVKARKRFGQHFLEPAWVAKLIDVIAPAPTDRFIEIGPGRGAITEPLSAHVAQLIAIEVDRDLAAALQARELPNVEVVTADVLEVDLASIVLRQQDSDSALAESRFRVAGNLPYNISSPILFRLLDAAAGGLLIDATLMLQKEVAGRLVARPSTKEYGVLTVLTALGADVTRLLSLPPGAFRPAPAVHSAVVRLTFHPVPSEVHHRDLLVRIVRSVFTQRRKTMANALTPVAASAGWNAHDVLAAAGIDARRRPETLTLLDFAKIADRLAVAATSPPA